MAWKGKGKGEIVYDYMVFDDDGIIKAQDVNGRIVSDNVDPDVPMAYCLANLPSDGGVIYIRDPMVFSDDQTISIDSTSIISDRIKLENDNVDAVYFYRIIISGVAASTHNVRLQGLQFRELVFNAGANVISNVLVDYCNFRTGTYEHAVRFVGNTNYIMEVDFNFCVFWDYAGWATPPGIISWEHTGEGSGQIHFNECYFVLLSDNGQVLVMESDTALDSIWFTEPTFLVGTGQTGCNIVRMMDGADLVIKINEALFEPKEDLTIFLIDNSAADSLRLHGSVENCDFLGDAGDTITLITNNAAAGDWQARINRLEFLHNKKTSAAGTVVVGTPVQCANFTCVLDHFHGIADFEGVQETMCIASVLVGLPAAGTVYSVFNGVGSHNAAEGDRTQIVSEDGIISGARARLAVAPGAGDTRVCTLRVNGVNTAIVLNFGAADTTATSANTVAVNAGDRVGYRWTLTGVPNISTAQESCCLRFTRAI